MQSDKFCEAGTYSKASAKNQSNPLSRPPTCYNIFYRATHFRNFFYINLSFLLLFLFYVEDIECLYLVSDRVGFTARVV